MSVRVSVVVPTRRRTALLRRCLSALLAQDFDAGAYEILVAGDGADRATERLVAEVRGARRRPALRYIPVVDGHGPAAARNRACQLAFGEVIAFTDDDCVPAVDWLRVGVESFRPGVGAVAGRIIMPLPRRPTDYEADAARLQGAEFTTANCFCLRDSLVAAGGFDERFRRAGREDSDLFFSLLEQGVEIVHEPRAVVVHPVRPACWGVSLLQQRNNFFESLLYKKHPAFYRSRARRPWRYYGSCLALTTVGGGAVMGSSGLVAVAGVLWLTLTACFCWDRLRATSRHPIHVLEVAITSALIPPVALFWRLAGAMRHRILLI